jgi:uncharacterized protein
MITDELQKLRDLYEQGAIDAAEYTEIKQRLLNAHPSHKPHDLLGLSLPSYNALLHASQYMGYLLPYIGLVLPFILWIRVRDRYPEVDAHGKCAANWVITELIFTTLLVLLGVGLFLGGIVGMTAPEQPFYALQLNRPAIITVAATLLWIIAVMLGLIKLCGTVFPLIATVRALNGKTFQYPFAIRFLK